MNKITEGSCQRQSLRSMYIFFCQRRENTRLSAATDYDLQFTIEGIEGFQIHKLRVVFFKKVKKRHTCQEILHFLHVLYMFN